MSGRVAGKVALITGAGSGIGRATAIRLAEEGAEVVVTSQTAANVEETRRLAAEASAREVIARTLDIADRSSVDLVVAEVVEQFGHIDILSNNAGIELVHGPSVVETTDEEWERVFRVNMTGTFYVCRAAVPHMPSGSSIVNMASINSFIAWENDAVYTATKGALLQFTRSLALELAPKAIRANAVCPGVIDTPLTDLFLDAADDPGALRRDYEAASPLLRMGTAREVANCVVFLASDEATFITGSALIVDGGTTAR
ncbi:MAG: SDR family oxidoreductase [Thermoleophilia bacterium]|nr:SDR family oxidoreductase [Thermoleophilia bacterium]